MTYLSAKASPQLLATVASVWNVRTKELEPTAGVGRLYEIVAEHPSGYEVRRIQDQHYDRPDLITLNTKGQLFVHKDYVAAVGITAEKFKELRVATENHLDIINCMAADQRAEIEKSTLAITEKWQQRIDYVRNHFREHISQEIDKSRPEQISAPTI